MLLHILAVGKIGRCPEADLVDRYLARIAWPVRITESPDGRAPKWPTPLAPHRTLVLDERGKTLDSIAFSALLGQWRDGGVRETRLLIGGADGHDDAVRAEADFLLSFGPMTWPHMMVRAMLAEQLYRALAILAGHPYHRAG
ncbi:23S rRNA (pseudouridine(1915)-N(3))-methyltransferase RlmH [Hankyongella ginsenosidimutans]|uniref:Ribosomal RNA large subunit methyltransferase H n=1 Tax=Hankyongella ginsenosidimutans TaxID=1763828 RepID=A0A4D7C0N6_9SPHN|nr:23S rRNA (pseudouridine(1915)-N(3))-methyltransferase RlmH [Hankyongella ginsenosidimutans]QCI79284.1 23S rRNA (pseudouridine(1915)-N(3))-methyltransferase RlmH [Hankyongella ginsenosidimutans]